MKKGRQKNKKIRKKSKKRQRKGRKQKYKFVRFSFSFPSVKREPYRNIAVSREPGSSLSITPRRQFRIIAHVYHSSSVS